MQEAESPEALTIQPKIAFGSNERETFLVASPLRGNVPLEFGTCVYTARSLSNLTKGQTPMTTLNQTLRIVGILMVASGFLALAGGRCGLEADAQHCSPVSLSELTKLGGNTNPFAKKNTVTPNLACNTACYNAGGHDFMCQDTSTKVTLGITGANYTTSTMTKCTALFRYNSTNKSCQVKDTTFTADCDDSHAVYTDP